LKTLIVIPARLASTRLNNKLLLSETGQPLIQHTWQAAIQSQVADDVLVAADDRRLVDAVQSFGGRAELTRSDHSSGTDRLAEIAERYPDVELFINVQGDEPEIDPRDIDRAARLLLDQPPADMATLATPIRDPDLVADPACVKVVFDRQGRALYFSRSPIPCLRDGLQQLRDTWPGNLYFQHVGLYVYRRDTLLELTAAERPAMEIAESLEQLRALHLGKTILVGLTDHASRGIDTAEDYQSFVSRFTSC
jgi:3-deoxy-manno-octulosonate cytidylyltransferase (CMP-KDO synthetase)